MSLLFVSVVVLIASLHFTVLVCDQHDLNCFPKAEQKTLTFYNNNTNIIDHLPTIRFIQGYWASQWALQYVGYIFIKEKMGLNVEFFPKLSSGLGFADLTTYKYPYKYWEHLEHDDYDLLLEMWPAQNVNKYYDRGTVIFGGINDIYGEIGFFIPEYVYDEEPHSVVLAELKHNNVLRQQFIDGYTIKSDRDWVKYWNNTLYNDSELLSSYLSYGYILPTYDKPILWGSTFTYSMSQYTHNMTQFVNIFNDTQPGLDWIFVPLGTEGLLTEFVVDLYNNKQPFIANIYSPHTDFSTTSELTSDYMQFEPIAVHRNTDNSRDAKCYSKEYQCKEPVTPLFKLGNAKLTSRFPELAAFLFDFNILAENLNDILAYHQESNDWFNATCKWLLLNENKISEWNQEIIRYDCSPFNGCGFTVGNDKNIGGYCANSSIQSLCICTDEALGGIDCRTHCPGLIGPIFDEINTINNTYYFQQCSNNGICDNEYWSCSCNEGFGGNGCDIEYKQFSFYKETESSEGSVFILWMLLLNIISLVIILSIIWLWMNQKYKSVKILAARMSTLFSIGLILLCVGTMLFLIQPIDTSNYNIICNLRIYCYGLGAVLSISAPLLKAYRVNTIYNQAKKVDTIKKIKIPDTKLVISLINAVIIEFIVCIFYSILSDDASIIYNDFYYRIEYECNSNFITNLLWTANLLYVFFLLLILCFFAWKNREIKSFVESKCQNFGSVISVFLFIVTVIFYAVTSDTFILLNIQCGAIFIGVCIVWFLFYGRQIYRFYKYPKSRTEFSVTSRMGITTKKKSIKTLVSDKNQTNNNDDEGSKGLDNNNNNNNNNNNTTPQVFEADEYDYPDNERTIRYTNDIDINMVNSMQMNDDFGIGMGQTLQVNHGKSVSLTPTAAPFTIISTPKKKYKNDVKNLQQILDENMNNNNENENEIENVNNNNKDPKINEDSEQP